MLFAKGFGHQISLRGDIPYIRNLQTDLEKWLIGFMRQYRGEDIWATTLAFGYELPPTLSQKRRTAFIKRLQQGQRDSGGGELLFLIVTAFQKRKVIHYHMMVLGEGLGKLHKELWIERWKEITKADFTGCSIFRGKRRYGIRIPCETLQEKRDCRLCEFYWEKKNTSSCKISQADEGWAWYMVKNCNFSDVGIELKGKIPSALQEVMTAQ